MMRRTTAKAPTTANAPTRVGINAATRLPKMSRLKMNTIGIEIDSARAMSSVDGLVDVAEDGPRPADVRGQAVGLEGGLDLVVARRPWRPGSRRRA